MEGLEETVERLKAEGVKVTLEPKTLTADGNYYRIAFIEDPDGYKIELVERGTMKVGRCSGRLPEDGSREVYLWKRRGGARWRWCRRTTATSSTPTGNR